MQTGSVFETKSVSILDDYLLPGVSSRAAALRKGFAPLLRNLVEVSDRVL
jgi:hypothetical protein